MLKILFGFLPWIVYFALIDLAHLQPEIASGAGLLTTCVLGFRELKKGFVLVWCTVAFFALSLGLMFFFPTSWPVSHPELFAYAAFAAISWFSLLIRKPFSLQYAREQTPKEIQELPSFFRINQIITVVWSAALTLCALTSALDTYTNISRTVNQIVPYAVLAFAIWFTVRFPNWQKQRGVDRLIRRSEQSAKTTQFLKGNFAPVFKEIDRENLPIEGELPKDLVGIYMRNGANPAFAPFSYTYPFDGDGMLHAVYIRDGKASYRNRFVETDQLKTERRLKMAVYGGVDCPFIRNQKLLSPEDPQFPVKMGRFIHIIRHANQYVALHEACSAYEVNAQLETLGEWNPTNAKTAISVNPHPRVDPVTGEIYLISYHIDQPRVTYHVLDKMGRLAHAGSLDVPHSCMIHDFVLTKNYFVLFLCPVLIDMYGVPKGKHTFNWQPECKTLIAVVPRPPSQSPAIWIEEEPFFNYHFANAFENGSEIVVDYIRYPQFAIALENLGPGHLYRTTIDLRQKRCSHKQMDDRNVEFPRINDAKNASSYRYAYIPANLNNLMGETFNAIAKYDLKTGGTTVHDFGADFEIGEAVFTPRANASEEDDGYLMLFASRKSTEHTDFFLLDAKHLSGKPLARISLPQRIPHGLHGSWMPGPW